MLLKSTSLPARNASDHRLVVVLKNEVVVVLAFTDCAHNDGVAGLVKCARDVNVARLIALATTMETHRDCPLNNNVARLKDSSCNGNVARLKKNHLQQGLISSNNNSQEPKEIATVCYFGSQFHTRVISTLLPRKGKAGNQPPTPGE